jgi:hypothetical protein
MVIICSPAVYHRKIEQEIQLIIQLVKNKAIPVATLSELEKSIKSINTGKSADIYSITIEHIITAGEQMITIILQIVNTIFDHGSVPDILKVGLLTPVFKNKGNIAEVIYIESILYLLDSLVFRKLPIVCNYFSYFLIDP